ncbi:hypothetical protein ACP4OV_007581 [Aristida adscensionis]
MDPDGSTPCIQGCAIFLLYINLKSTCYWLQDHHISSPARASVIRPNTTSVRPAKLKKPRAKVTRDKAANEGCFKEDPLFLRLEPLLGKTFKYAGPEMHKLAVAALGDFDATLSKGEAMVVEGHKMVQEGHNMMTQGNLMMTDGQQIILKAQEDIVAKIKRIADVAARQRKRKAGQTTLPSVPMCTPPSEDEAEELVAHVTTMSDPIVPITEPTSAAVVPSAGMHHDDNTGHVSPAPSVPTACAASAPTGGGNDEARNFDHSFGDDAQPGIAVGDDAADPEPSGKISQECNISEPPVLQPPEESGEKGQEDRAKLSATAAGIEQGGQEVRAKLSAQQQLSPCQVNDLTIEDSSQSSLGGVNNRDFDWARWAHVAQATREHDTDDSQKDVHSDKHDPKVSDDASLDAAKGNPEHKGHDPCLEEAEAVYYAIFDLDNYQSTYHISLTGSQILDQFSQGNMIEDDVITFFLTCLVHDEQTSRPSSAGYRVFLDPTVSGMLLSEDYGTSSIFEVQDVIHVLQERYKPEQFINATHAEASNDCGILMMLGLEFYDPDSWKIRYEIRPEDGMDYRVKVLYYMMFHQVNCAKSRFPELIEERAPKAMPFPTLDDDAPATS